MYTNVIINITDPIIIYNNDLFFYLLWNSCMVMKCVKYERRMKERMTKDCKHANSDYAYPGPDKQNLLDNLKVTEGLAEYHEDRMI